MIIIASGIAVGYIIKRFKYIKSACMTCVMNDNDENVEQEITEMNTALQTAMEQIKRVQSFNQDVVTPRLKKQAKASSSSASPVERSSTPKPEVVFPSDLKHQSKDSDIVDQNL